MQSFLNIKLNIKGVLPCHYLLIKNEYSQPYFISCAVFELKFFSILLRTITNFFNKLNNERGTLYLEKNVKK